MTFEYILNEQKRESEAIGFEKGRSEGAAQKQREIAKNFKQAGIPIEILLKIQDYPVKKSKNYRHGRVTRMAKTH